MRIYYNEIDEFSCAWLKELISMGSLPDGDIDCRSINDVQSGDLVGYDQCHFFTGIGGWPLALRQAGWDEPVWTGSCPCQPFSNAGKQKGFADERHLWPVWYRLISQCKPPVIFGEQVASNDAKDWFDLVCADLERVGYQGGAQVATACGYGAPHIRQRLYWMAYSKSGRELSWECRQGQRPEWETGGCCSVGRMAYAAGRYERRSDSSGRYGGEAQGSERVNFAGINSVLDGVELAECERLERQRRHVCPETGRQVKNGQTANASHVSVPANATNGFWSNPDWLWCRDQRWRPVESQSSPLVNGVPSGMVRCCDKRRKDFRAIKERLKGYGNAIVVPQAVEFIKVVKEWIDVHTRGQS